MEYKKYDINYDISPDEHEELTRQILAQAAELDTKMKLGKLEAQIKSDYSKEDGKIIFRKNKKGEMKVLVQLRPENKKANPNWIYEVSYLSPLQKLRLCKWILGMKNE